VHGFASAADYYERSSARHFLGGIRRPTLLLSAYDDPFLPPDVLDDVAVVAEENRFIDVEFHRHGGHVGFVSGRAPWRPVYYAEQRVVEYLSGHLNARRDAQPFDSADQVSLGAG
jgi:predicted alpha/beta-fold hydrolase